MKPFDSAQGAFIKYHSFPRTHILTLQREILMNTKKKRKKEERNKTAMVPFQEYLPVGRGDILVGDRPFVKRAAQAQDA